MDVFGVTDAAECIDVPHRALRAWAERDQLVLPDVLTPKKDKFQFSTADLIHLRLVATVITHGAGPKAANGLAQQIEEKVGFDPAADDLLTVWRGRRGYLLWEEFEDRSKDWTVGIFAADAEVTDWSGPAIVLLNFERMMDETLARAAAIQERRAA